MLVRKDECDKSGWRGCVVLVLVVKVSVWIISLD